MADVFLSYSREDSDAAGRIAHQLEAEGMAVFWDKEIPPGVSWADYLQDKLTSAKCVIVLWSAASVGSQWVREEARIGRDAAKLLPVFLDTSAPPFGFGEVQSASLSGWNGEPHSEDWRRLAEAVRAAVSRGGAAPVLRKPAAAAAPGFKAPPASVPNARSGTPARKGTLRLVAFGAAGMFGLLLVIGLMQGGAPDLAASRTEILSPADASGGLLAPASPPPGPSPQAPSAPAAIDPAIQAVLNAALADDAAAQKAAAAARALAEQGRSAAAAGQAGSGGFGSQMLPDGSMIAGDLLTFMAMQPALVGVQSPSTGLQFFGRYQQLADGYAMNGVAATGAISGAGAWRYRIDGYDFTGQGVLAGGFTVSGVERGEAGGSSGRGVVAFADGRRYVGEYRTTGQGAYIDLVLEGRGALYSAGGVIDSIGRFSGNVVVSPN
jgi:hypothetical protein